MAVFSADWFVEMERAAPGGLALRCDPGDPPPARVSDGGLTLVFDGLLHDREALARRWGVDAGRGDAQLVLDAFCRGGQRVLPTLRGRFALVIFVAAREELLALRDPVGTRPLFFARRPRDVIVGRSPELLLRQPGVERRVDPLFAAATVVLGLAGHPEETMFAGVRRVPAGNVLRVRGARAERDRFWGPGEAIVPARDEREQFAARLEQAVARCGGGRFGVLLSGGLDSATVAASAARVSRARGTDAPCAISLLSHVPESDESATQHAVARELRLDIVAGRTDEVVRPRDLLSRVMELAARCAWPPGPSLPATELLCRRALEAGCQTVLTGDGGDEWLMPARGWAAERLARLDLRSLLWIVRAWDYYAPAATAGERARSILLESAIRPHARALAWRLLGSLDPARARRTRAARFSRALPAWDWLLPAPSRRRELAEWWLDREPARSPAQQYREEHRSVLEATFTSAMMEDHFAMSRRLGAELLRPLWDPDLVDFLAALPAQALVRGGRAKALERDYLAAHLRFAERWPGKTYGDPVVRSLVEREGRSAWSALGGTPILAELGLVDPDRLEGWFATSSPGEPRPDAAAVWDAITLENWLRTRLYSPRHHGDGIRDDAQGLGADDAPAGRHGG